MSEELEEKVEQEVETPKETIMTVSELLAIEKDMEQEEWLDSVTNNFVITLCSYAKLAHRVGFNKFVVPLGGVRSWVEKIHPWTKLVGCIDDIITNGFIEFRELGYEVDEDVNLVNDNESLITFSWENDKV